MFGGDRLNVVEPIRSIEKVKEIGNSLKARNERNYIMYLIGIYSGLRISDILKLKVRDVLNKDCINIKEKKTGKQKIFAVNPFLKKELSKYISVRGLKLEEYLIKRQGEKNEPITRYMAYRILNKVAKLNGLENIGTHTLRKTFGYHFYIQTKDIVSLQKIYNHSDPKVTLRYIGIEREELNKKMESLKLF